MLDPQVQIHIIDLARELVDATLIAEPPGQTQETLIKKRAKMFDVAYKALLKRVRAK